MKGIIKTIGKGIGKGVGAAAYYSLAAVGAAIGKTWEKTGDRGMVRDALSDNSNQDLMGIFEKHKDDDGDYDTYIATKSLLGKRAFICTHKTNKWGKHITGILPMNRLLESSEISNTVVFYHQIKRQSLQENLAIYQAA